MECEKVAHGVRKAKKKPVKDEMDRIKQAEKKKRRLEKALANSAAIRSELEKKKQKKIEEQKRLDEEGAAIAEAVALNVLLDEDSDEGLNDLCDTIRNIEFMTSPYRNFPDHPAHEALRNGWVPNVYGNLNEFGNGRSSVLSGHVGQNNYMPYTGRLTSDVIVAHAVASLRIAEEAQYDPRVYGNGLRG